MTRTDKAVIVAGIKKSFGSVAALRDVSSRSNAAKFSVCWARTAPGRPRPSTSCRR